MSTTTKIYCGIGMLLAVGAFVYLGFTRPPFPRVYLNGTRVVCLPKNGDILELAFKMQLRVTVDGSPEQVPANIGNTTRCRAELRTHKNDGVVLVELFDADRLQELSFIDFFTVWNMPIEREGFKLQVFVDRQEVGSIADVPLADGLEVELRYTAMGEGKTDE